MEGFPIIRIVSIISNEYIPAGRTLQWPVVHTDFIYLEALDSLQASWNNTHSTLHREDCLLAQSVALHNSRPDVATIRAVRLQGGLERSHPIGSVVSRLQPAEVALLKEIFAPLFQDPSRIAECEDSISHLFQEWFNPILPGADQFPHLHGQMDPRLIKVNRYLRNHCEEAITLQQLADLIQCNPVYLSNMYSKIFHISPIQHLQKMKMENAKKLLSFTDMNVGEVSQRLGYASPSQFSDLFKRHYQVTPLQFRRNSRLMDHDRTDKNCDSRKDR